jgi:hypothetical protein
MDAQALTRDLRRHHVIGRGHEEEPLVDYALLITSFVAVTGVSLARAAARGTRPDRFPLSDVLLLGLAAARLTRLFTREKVTRVVRAPFTEVDADARQDEVKEHPRGQGLTRAMGELLTCPRCFGMWTSAGMGVAYVFAPVATRIASGILAISLVNDLANVRFARARAARRRIEAPAT